MCSSDLTILSGLLLGASAALAVETSALPAPIWPDTFLTRVESLALLETFNAALLSHNSATATLEQWCGDHQLATPPLVVAEQQHNLDRPPTAEQRQLLRVTSRALVRYRHVRLRCGSLVLAEADNWYVPGRLTAQMNHLLTTTDVPFGKVVGSLHFQRRTISAELLWFPLPLRWEMAANVGTAAGAELSLPTELLRHRAVLTLPDGRPFSTVVETYNRNLLAFPAPLVPGDSARNRP